MSVRIQEKLYCTNRKYLSVHYTLCVLVSASFSICVYHRWRRENVILEYISDNYFLWDNETYTTVDVQLVAFKLKCWKVHTFVERTVIIPTQRGHGPVWETYICFFISSLLILIYLANWVIMFNIWDLNYIYLHIERSINARFLPLIYETHISVLTWSFENETL